MSEVQFTYDGIPDLPDVPEAPQRTFDAQGRRPSSTNGIAQFEIVPKRKADGTYRNVEYVTILTPGDPKAQPRHKVTDEIRQKYAYYYRMFRQGLEVTSDGTPLEAWPVLTPAQIKEFKINNIFTVEQLRDMADSNDHRIPMVGTFKKRAKQWLETKKNADLVDQQAKENDTLRQGMSMLEQQLADMQRKMEKMGMQDEPESEPETVDGQLDAAVDKLGAKKASSKRGPGRPKKEA